MLDRIRATGIGPVAKADISFGDVTVFVGPQATGKGIFLQLLKLLVDSSAIHGAMKQSGLPQCGSARDFLDQFFGEGMASIWSAGKSSLILGRARMKTDLETYARPGRTTSSEKLLYIPAQRVLCLRDGITHPFTDYRAGDPFVLRDFSDKLHGIVQSEVDLNGSFLPFQQRLEPVLRTPLEEHILGGLDLRTDPTGRQGRLVLELGAGRPLPYSVWSAGQRHFVPLLLALHWLIPASKVPRRNAIEWVVIEEPEMGLHPTGVGAVLNLVMDLRSRGYRVCISTHSPHVLDVIWALQFLQENGGDTSDALGILGLKPVAKTREVALTALNTGFRTYCFKRNGTVSDISGLDPDSDRPEESGWGGLTGFTGRVGDVVAEVSNRALHGVKAAR